MGVCHAKALLLLVLSSIRSDRAAAVKDLVVEAVLNSVEGVTGVFGSFWTP